MEFKDVEKKLEEAADNMELRPFSQRWEIIKNDIKIPRAKKRKTLKKWLPSVAAACAVILSGAIILPIALRNQPSGDFAPNSGEFAPDDVVPGVPDEGTQDIPNGGVAEDGDIAEDQDQESSESDQ